ncbi:thioredoxin family protein [Amphritea sp. HPY]|uniref:thioredoxin family protein n=1 Tax=Amphritea sp. HPY TaxID=3421652 RepID=UPI003D7D9F6A
MKLQLSFSSFFSNTLLSAVFLFFSATAFAQPLPVLSNLQQDQQLAGNERFLLVLVSQPGCSYCELIEEEILKPMQISGHYDAKLLFRNLIIHDDRSMTDLTGIRLDTSEFARRYGTSLTPTLLFLDPQNSTELVQKMVGISTVEMYGYYVDKAVAQASDKLQMSSTQP